MSEWIFDQTKDWWLELIGQAPDLTTFDEATAAAAIPRSDLGAARIIAKKMGKALTYVELLEQWHVWDGRVHAPLQSDAVIIRLIGEFADALAKALSWVEEYYEAQAQAAQALGTQNGTQAAQQLRARYRTKVFGEHRKFRDRSYSTAGLRSIVSQLKAEVSVSSDYYNDDRQWLVVENGVIDLSTIPGLGEREFPALLDHSQDRPVTRYFKAEYDPQKPWPEWDHFLKKSLPDAESRMFMMKISGAAFMAAPKTKVIPNLQGPKDSGKTVFIDTLHVLGGDYSVQPMPSALLKQTGTNFEQDKLRNKRFVGVSEPDVNAQLDDGFVKRVSGGDWTETRTLNAKSSGWYPQCVMMVASNHAVRFNTRDDALLERVALVNFPIQFLPGAHVPEEYRRDDDLKDKLLAEGSGILNWLIWGMKYYVREGIQATQSIVDNRREMQAAGSTALQWVHDFEAEGWLEVIDESDAARVPGRDLMLLKDAYLQYQVWASEAGERYPLSRKFFSQDLQNRYGKLRMADGSRLPRLRWTEKWDERHRGLPQQTESGFTF